MRPVRVRVSDITASRMQHPTFSDILASRMCRLTFRDIAVAVLKASLK